MSVIAAGSPGPFERKTPSGFNFFISSKVVSSGKTWTSIPRSAMAFGVAPFMPRSIAATLNLVATPTGGETTYGLEVVTSLAK